MSGVNPPDIPGYTQMYTFGIKYAYRGRRYLVITVRAPTEEAAKRHVEAIFEGRYQKVGLHFYTDLDEWKMEANTTPLADYPEHTI